MALSVSRDKTLRTWNLMTARTAFITNIKQSKKNAGECDDDLVKGFGTWKYVRLKVSISEILKTHQIK